MSIKVGNNSIAKIMYGSKDVSKVFYGNVEVYSAAPSVSFPAVPYKASWTAAQMQADGLLVAKSASQVIKYYAYSKEQGMYCGIYPSGNLYRVCFMSKTQYTKTNALLSVFYDGSHLAAYSTGAVQQVANTFWIGYTEINNEYILEASIPYYTSETKLLNDARLFFLAQP